ncbi:isoaspartyl peptidase/L-asparaginase family protein [Sphingomonas sp. SRS2]|uniref:isoaspartyl peptidase/L-asparaginase family protein n=1 Tax=Sphingomonas sp. SRS2 TaxID=133190 RepID=UPI0006183F24|nr:isoaspartyl peptidase/L-asparaginase [Sphingomonas sp. SRS2]KKC26248.1 asparaginase [Sphingomonas sp. SRS2]
MAKTRQITSHWTGPTEGWTLVIHGGAGQLKREQVGAEGDAHARAAIAAALDAGASILAGHGSALDAVEAAVRVLEDDPHFNAGRGSVFSAEGINELDAAIMEGTTREAGAVSAVTKARHPVALARAVMEQSPHVMLTAAGADRFGAEHGLEQAAPAWFHTDERWRQYEELRAGGTFDADLKYGTVGAVARDTQGRLAAATSTGGLTGKRWNRIGDSPVIGAGTWADDRGAATSCTGSGEHFIRVGAAHELSARVRLAGAALGEAGDGVIGEIGAIGGVGGLISVDHEGRGGWSFNSGGMYRGMARADQPQVVAIYGDE